MRGGFKPVIPKDVLERVKNRKSQDRQEFIALLKYVQQMMGPDPATFGDETQEQMEKISKRRSSEKKKKRRKLESAIEEIKALAEYYPPLKKEFAKELKELK